MPQPELQSAASGGVDAMKFAALTYAAVLLLGALGVIALAVYEQHWLFVGTGVLLFLGAVTFFWAHRQRQDPPKNSGDGKRASTAFLVNLAGSLRQFGLTLTGAGIGVSLAMFVLLIPDIQHPAGVPIGSGFLFLSGCVLTLLGSLFIIVDAMNFRRTGRRF